VQIGSQTLTMTTDAIVLKKEYMPKKLVKLVWVSMLKLR